ncbi:periplasmic binding protein-like I [Mucor mucedo]|uniref:periplasmic binding protein-like I n=1 Tax=Mucor mucedo TaxID=29922 RepID=UPI00221F4E54|nr:periplasmic binding protein-like I [Mucor mucedo]KAI7887263.1 periplasmic binding protein-like I [Mucor mucedo]
MFDLFYVLKFFFSAVIGDMVSEMTEASASLTGLWQIPQCSCASASLTLSDKKQYPYFFRTAGSAVLFGESLVDWVNNMKWDMFALVYTNDLIGQQVLQAMSSRASEYGITTMTRIPLYSLNENRIEKSLSTLEESGCRVVVLADSRTIDQVLILKKAMQMGLMKKGWVWVVMNDISPVLLEKIQSPEELAMYDGLMFISGLWDLKGLPEYDNLNRLWKTQQVPDDFTTKEDWSTLGLSYNAPSAYACTELLALGLSHALDNYPGGRPAGISDLRNSAFNSSNMTPYSYNLNYTGPSGYMEFSEEGDLQSGYFELLYMRKGLSVPYATIKVKKFEFYPNTSILYLGPSTEKPTAMMARYALNPSVHNAAGITALVICSIGIVCCKSMMVLIFFYQYLKPIMVSSPVFCYLQLSGISMIYTSILLYLGKPNVGKCIAVVLLTVIGFVLVIGSLIAKNYRIYRIFQNVFTVRTTRLKSYYLVRIVALFVIIAISPLIVWYALYPVVVKDVMVSNTTYCWLCTYPAAKVGYWGHITISEIVVLIWCSILIIISAFLAFKTRTVSSKWSETTQITYVSYNTGIASLVACPGFFLSTENYSISMFLKISSVLFAATFTLVVLYLPKFIIIARHIIKHNKKLSLYRMNTSSEVELTKHTYSTSSDEKVNLNLVARNLFDFTVEAHEGILPVKKLARYEFFSIWELKHIILVPLKRFFVLSNKTGDGATMHAYVDCEMVNSTEENHHIFRVRTDAGLVFLFQVSDNTALKRWIKWFKGGAPASDNNTANQVAIATEDQQVLPLDQLSRPKMQTATFGVGDSSSSVAQPLVAAYSSFYSTNLMTNSHQQSRMNSESYSTMHGQSMLSSQPEQPMGASNSFGIMDSNWQRYP